MSRVVNLDITKTYSSVFLILYLCLGFVPNLQAVDKIAPQWLFMGMLNLFSLIYFIYYREKYLLSIFQSISSFLIITYTGFIFWGAFSYFYAINPTEVLVNISRQINVFLMVVFMTVHLYNLKNKLSFIPYIMGIILSIEIYYVLVQTIDTLDLVGNLIERASIKGVAANPNITAFSIANKLPFVIYLIIFSDRKISKLFSAALLLLSILCLSIIQSRASYLAVIFIYLVTFSLLIFLYLKTKKKKFLHSLSIILSTILIGIISNQLIFSNKGADALKRISTISVTNTDDSISARLRYYSHVLEQVKESKIFGVGLGNWKLKSIKYESQNLLGYIVPYHAHSDFIQLGAELGIVGFILYLGIFLWAVIYVFRLIIKSSLGEKEKVFLFFMLLSLGSYTIDANLNFPIARPQVLVIWGIVLAFIIGFYQKVNFKDQYSNLNKKITSTSFFVISLIALIPSLFISFKVYESLKGQMQLLQDFNSNQYNIPLNKVENITPNIPNITVTTIPINSVKARYFVKNKKYDKAIKLIESGTKANPFLFYSEILKSQIYEELGKLDSAKFYAKKAFFGLPNNQLHSSTYLNLVNITRDKNALEDAFNLLVINNDLTNWKNYLTIASGLYPPGDKVIVERAKNAVQIFPNNSDIKNLLNSVSVGRKQMIEAVEASKIALEYFNSNEFEKAAIEFEKAIKLNSADYSNYENAAIANYMTGNLYKAIEQIDKVINDMNPLNGKCEYIKALIFIKLGDHVGACPLLATSRDSGNTQASGIFDQYCR